MTWNVCVRGRVAVAADRAYDVLDGRAGRGPVRDRERARAVAGDVEGAGLLREEHGGEEQPPQRTQPIALPHFSKRACL